MKICNLLRFEIYAILAQDVSSRERCGNNSIDVSWQSRWPNVRVAKTADWWRRWFQYFHWSILQKYFADLSDLTEQYVISVRFCYHECPQVNPCLMDHTCKEYSDWMLTKLQFQSPTSFYVFKFETSYQPLNFLNSRYDVFNSHVCALYHQVGKEGFRTWNEISKLKSLKD